MSSDDDERDALAAYKQYSIKHLGNPETLADLFFGDFDPTLHDAETADMDEMGRLEIYLKRSRKYVKELKRAAYLRQQHYEHFLSENTEEDGHRNWRICMNQLSSDAEAKLLYWESQLSKKWDEVSVLCEQRATQPEVCGVFRYSTKIRNPDFEKKKPCKTHIVRPPAISARIRKQLSEGKKKDENTLLLDLISTLDADQVKRSEIERCARIKCMQLVLKEGNNPQTFGLDVRTIIDAMQNREVDIRKQGKLFLVLLAGCKILCHPENQSDNVAELICSMFELYRQPIPSEDEVAIADIVRKRQLFICAMTWRLHDVFNYNMVAYSTKLILKGRVAPKKDRENNKIKELGYGHIIGAIFAMNTPQALLSLIEEQVFQDAKCKKGHKRQVATAMAYYNVGVVMNACAELARLHSILSTVSKDEFLFTIKTCPKFNASLNLDFNMMPLKIGRYIQKRIPPSVRKLYDSLRKFFPK